LAETRPEKEEKEYTFCSEKEEKRLNKSENSDSEAVEFIDTSVNPDDFFASDEPEKDASNQPNHTEDVNNSQGGNSSDSDSSSSDESTHAREVSRPHDANLKTNCSNR